MFKQYFQDLSRYFASQPKRLQQLTAGLVILVVAIGGTILLLGSHAANPYTSSTASSGTLAGCASPQSDSTASSGTKVIFGASCCSGIPADLSTPNPTINPYIDPSQLCLGGGDISFYDQPSRGYMQTVPATQFLSGIGVNYNPGGNFTVAATVAQNNADLQYLASIGVHAIRIEFPWDAVSPGSETPSSPGSPGSETQLTASSEAKYSAIFADCKQYGITPTVLLNANSGGPEPSYQTYKATVVGTPKVGDSQITVKGIPASDIVVHQSGTSNGSSGISYGSGGQTAANLITKEVTNSDTSLTLTLSQPLASLPGNVPNIYPGGTSGSTSYSYEVAAINSSGKTISVTPVGSTSTGNAKLSSANSNFLYLNGAVSGAVSYNIYRTASSGTPSSTGLIGNITSASYYFNDTGLAASGSVPASSPIPITINYFKYMPLYPVGTPEFNNTMAGWMQYVKTATNTVEAAGLTNYSVEIWNELTFGSLFLNINDYYPSTAPLISSVPSSLFSGGSMWELGNQTTQYLKSTYGSNVKVIWGFSNTTFYHTPSNELPANIDGESYHPYGTQESSLCSFMGSSVCACNNKANPPACYEVTCTNASPPVCTPVTKPNSKIIGGTYIPSLDVALPEGANAATLPFSETTDLIQGKLQPDKREASLPPGTTNFLHYITETGVEPNGFTDYANQWIKAESFLREYSFWLNKGLNQFDVYAAFSDGPTPTKDDGWNMLANDSDVPGTAPATLQSQAIGNFTSQFAGATNISNPTQLGVSVTDMTPNDTDPSCTAADFATQQSANENANENPNNPITTGDPITARSSTNTCAYDVFPADPTTGEPALNYRQMFQFLPIQVNSSKFVIPTYVMSWNIYSPPPPMEFQVDVTNVDGNTATDSYYDPITGTSQPITVVSKSATDMVLDIQAVDYPRLITINDSGS